MKNKLDKMFTSDFIRVPRPFIRKFNLNTTVMLSEIYSEYTYWKDRNELQQGGWFYSTVENMCYNTGLSKHQQLVACKELEGYGIIKIKYHGMPKKRYFKFDPAAFGFMGSLYRESLCLRMGWMQCLQKGCVLYILYFAFDNLRSLF